MRKSDLRGNPYIAYLRIAEPDIIQLINLWGPDLDFQPHLQSYCHKQMEVFLHWEDTKGNGDVKYVKTTN